MRLHTFIVSDDTHGTSLTYMNTGGSEPVVVTFDNALPSPLYCGAGYERCNALVTSNTDESIQIAMFPQDSGIGLVSFNYFTHNDSLVYRDQFLLLQNDPNCTFVYFVDELIGYCLDLHLHQIRAFLVNIDFINLTASTIQRRDNTFEIENIMNITSLSNLIYFVEGDDCFSSEGSHVVFLDNGDLLDHSFVDGQISFHDVHEVDSTCSRLHRVGSMCGLAARCDNKVVLFDTRGRIDQTSFTVAEHGQTFFCPSEDFVRFDHEMLSLHHRNRQQFGNNVSFPFGKIRLGNCVNVADKFFFIATVSDGRTILVDFSDASYQHLGEGDVSTVISAKIEDHFAIINNGSDTDVYNLGLGCTPKPFVVQNNFVFVKLFVSSRTVDKCQCIESFPATVTPLIVITTTTTSSTKSSIPVSPTLSSSFAVPVSGSSSMSPLPTTLEPRLSGMASTISLSSSPTPTSVPASSHTNSSLIIGVVVTAVSVVVVLLFSVMITLCLVYVHKR